MRIEPCPICGKYPKVHRDYSYEAAGYGAWVTIQCKPFLRKPHLKIEEGKSTYQRALSYAVRRWNGAASNTRRMKMYHG